MKMWTVLNAIKKNCDQWKKVLLHFKIIQFKMIIQFIKVKRKTNCLKNMYSHN